MYVYGQNVIKERERKREGRKGGNRKEIGEEEEGGRGREEEEEGILYMYMYIKILLFLLYR